MFFAIMVLQTQQSEMLLSRLFSVGELCSNAHIAMKLSVPILTVHAICVALFTKYLCLWLGYSHINLSVVSRAVDIEWYVSCSQRLGMATVQCKPSVRIRW